MSKTLISSDVLRVTMRKASEAAGLTQMCPLEFSSRIQHYAMNEPKNDDEVKELTWIVEDLKNQIAFYEGNATGSQNRTRARYGTEALGTAITMGPVVETLRHQLELRTEEAAEWKSKFELVKAELEAYESETDSDDDEDVGDPTTPTKAPGSRVCPLAPKKSQPAFRATPRSSVARELFPDDEDAAKTNSPGRPAYGTGKSWSMDLFHEQVARSQAGSAADKRKVVPDEDILKRRVQDATLGQLHIDLANAYVDHQCTRDQLEDANVEINRLKMVAELDRRNMRRLQEDLDAKQHLVRGLQRQIEAMRKNTISHVKAEERAIKAYHEGLRDGHVQSQPGALMDDWDFVNDSLDDDDDDVPDLEEDDNPSGAPCVRAIATEPPRTTSIDVEDLKERMKDSRRLQLKIQENSTYTPMDSPFNAVAPDQMEKDLVLPKNDPQWKRWEAMVRHAPSIWCARLMTKPVQYFVTFKVAANGKTLTVDALNSSASDEDRRMVAKYGDRFWQVKATHSVSVWQLDVYREA